MTDSVVAAIVSGKTGTRTAFLFESVPALRNWMNHHPIKKGLLWIKNGKPYTRITTTAVYYRVQKLQDQAGMQKIELGLEKSIVHLFRHGRLTELAKDLTKAELAATYQFPLFFLHGVKCKLFLITPSWQ